MSVEALWTIEYENAGRWHNAGVVILQAGHVFGGDGQYYYVGRYSNEGVKVDAKILATHYSGASTSAFGVAAQRMTVEITGSQRPNVIEGYMKSSVAPGMHLPMRMTKRAELS